eukprot:4066832-Alexandrium_andersonii.AAC.1
MRSAALVTARTIRTRAARAVNKNAKQLREFFGQDVGATVVTEDGPVPSTWEEYLLAVFRERRWIDGIMLAGAAETLG